MSNYSDISSLNTRLSNAYARIGKLVIEKQSITEFLELGEILLNNPVILCDISTRGYGMSSREALLQANDELINSILEHGFVTADLFQRYDYDHHLPEMGKLSHAQIIPSSFPNKLNRIVGKVTFHNQFWGWLIALESKSNFSEEDTEIMDILAQAISLLLETENKSLSTDSNETVLLELLTSSYETSSEYEERAKGFSFETVGPWYIICIKNKNNQPSAALRAYRNHLSLILPSVSMAVYQDRLILLDHESEHSFVINTLNTFLKSNQLTAAVSSLFTDISEVPRYAIQAQDLLELAFILMLNDTILHFQNYSLYHAAFVIHKSSNADYYIPEELYSVMDYDSEYGTKYCDSIRSWLEFRSLVKAANALNIHRNTMVYHYDKFQELSGFDLSHGEDLFRLRLAFLLLDLQNKGYISQWDQTD